MLPNAFGPPKEKATFSMLKSFSLVGQVLLESAGLVGKEIGLEGMT